jgi:hypothetical protein
MVSTKRLCLTLSFMLCATAAPLKAQSESPLAIRIRQTIEAKELRWLYIVGFESGRVPLVPSEKRILVGVWERKFHGGGNDSVLLRVYGVDNSAEAQMWLSPASKGQVAAGWRISKYRIGDEGYLFEYQDGRQFGIQFRKGVIVAGLSGQDLRIVKRFAKYVVAQIPPSNDSLQPTRN